MRISIVILIVFLATSIASAQYLGHSLRVKSDSHVMSNPASDGREGGETVEDAFPIGEIPWNDSGATCDNIDDYDEVCPFSGSTAPDVVYSWTAGFDGELFVDLCGSAYDTKLYMYDSGFNLIDCNDDFYYDDFCGIYVSALYRTPVTLGETYYIVVDGYGSDCGEYVIAADEYNDDLCSVFCPDYGMYQFENEPPLIDGYEDNWNGGCNSASPVFQWLTCDSFCGKAGWYIGADGASYRDTDWLECTATGTSVTWTVDAAYLTGCYQLSIPDCDAVEVLLSMTVGPCVPGTMVMTTTPGEIIHLWVGSVFVTNPEGITGNEYYYVFTIDGVEEVSATENQTWSSVKSLYR